MSRCCVAVRLANSWVILGNAKGPHGGGPFYPRIVWLRGAGYAECYTVAETYWIDLR